MGKATFPLFIRHRHGAAVPRIPFVKAQACHPERSERRATHEARESKDPVSAERGHRRVGEFSAQTSPVDARGENASKGQLQTQANKGSFDSGNRFASESVSSAQDDREVFWAFVRAGRRLAE